MFDGGYSGANRDLYTFSAMSMGRDTPPKFGCFVDDRLYFFISELRCPDCVTLAKDSPRFADLDYISSGPFAMPSLIPLSKRPGL